MRTVWIALFLGAAALAAADVVHLTSGRKIKGEVISESSKEVVVRVAGSGKMSFPRKLVRKIERESQGATRLALARQRAREGAWGEALKLYRTAAEDPDPAISEPARRELAELEEARREAPKPKAAPKRPGKQPAAPSKPLDATPSAATPLTKGLTALKTGRPQEARAQFARLLKDSPSNQRYAYLYARALELCGQTQEAGKRYKALIGELGERRGLTPAWLGEIARRKLGGEAVATTSPGVGPGWSRVEAGEGFVIYHPFPKIESWLKAEPSKALKHVLKRLELDRSDFVWSGRVQIFLFPNKRAYEEAEGMELAGGHALSHAAPDGRLIQIRAYPLRAFYQTTFPHEVTHAVLFALHPDLPSWAHEGAAKYVETPRARSWSRGAVRGAKANKTLPSLRDFFRGGVARGANQAEVSAYYGLALVTFEAFVELTGDPKQALQLGREVNAWGAEAALKNRSLTWRQLEAAVEKASKNTAAGD